jgi:galactose mutarotase-like enzyme
MGISVTVGELCGWRSLTLANDEIRVVVLPDKGADVCSFVDLRTGVELLFQAPWGLQPPGSAAREGAERLGFLANYEGGWQELLPNTNDPCTVNGVDHPYHGEVATRPWTAEIVTDDERATVHLSIDGAVLPLRLERRLRVEPGRASLVVDETVTNLSADEVTFAWGHHLVLGAPLVGSGARLTVPCTTVVTPDELWEDTARLEPSQTSPWPMARLRAGGTADLSVVPGPELGAHDDVYLTGLREGVARLWNPALGLGFQLDFDPLVYRWLISWQPFGGARTLPLAGAYALGLEPWTSGGNLEKSIADGQALTLAAGGVLTTHLTATVLHDNVDEEPNLHA